MAAVIDVVAIPQFRRMGRGSDAGSEYLPAVCSTTPHSYVLLTTDEDSLSTFFIPVDTSYPLFPCQEQNLLII